MNIRTNYKHTITAGYISFITQAIVNNFAPLLYITFQKEWGITLSELAFISTYNFLVQLAVDLLSTKYADKIGIRRCIVFAHITSAAGFMGLGTLPYILGNRYAGIIISITMYAVGGGLIEVLASPIIESCPTENKEANMSLLHSFYCWGQVATVLFSTLFFSIFGIENWRIMAFIWAAIPIFNAVYFSIVPISYKSEPDKNGQKISELFKNKFFYILLIMMLCAGASELSIAQWASAFTEETLGISKTLGDILGPCGFAVLMGISRVAYSKLSNKLNLEKYILFCAGLGIVGYLMISLSHVPAVSLIGCAVCGYAVGIMWPGTYSIAAKKWKNPSTALFAFFALAGDFGCSSGPFIIGNISDHFGNDLKTGLFAGTLFPIIMFVATAILIKMNKQKEEI